MLNTVTTTDHDRMIEELIQFLSIPSVSKEPARESDCRHAAEWIADQLRAADCPTVEALDNEGLPVIWAESPPVEGAPTILFYGHYDIPPVGSVVEWKISPFEPAIRGGRVEACGASSKTQTYCLLKAYEASLDADRRPPVNVRFLIEGEGTSGSSILNTILDRDPQRLEADAMVVSELSYFDVGWPAIYTALRGAAVFEIDVRTAKRDLYAGRYGGVAPNAIEVLIRLITDLKKRSGRITLPDLYDASERPRRGERREWKKLPFDKKRFRTDELQADGLVGNKKLPPLERVWTGPSLEIHSLTGGSTDGALRPIIAATASAKLSLFVPPGLSTAKATKWLERRIADLTPKYAKVDVKILEMVEPAELDPSGPFLDALDQAFKDVVGRAPVAIRSGAAIPIVQRFATTGRPVIVTGISLPGDGFCSPNEKLDLQQLWDGIEVFERFLKTSGTGPADHLTTRAPESELEDEDEDKDEPN